MAKATKTVKINTKPKNDGYPKDKKTMMPGVVKSPTHVYTTNIGRSRVPSLRWELPEWDLAETGRILDTESIVRRAFRNKRNLFVKEGYEFVGATPERVQYIKRRIKQMEEATGLPFAVLMNQTIASLVRCQNAFWVKARKTEASGGRVRTTMDGKKLKPVAGYFPMPAETVRFKRDAFGKVKKYQQEVYGKEAIEFKPEDVIHFYFDKREGYAVGTPVLVSVKDDIRALRRIEENVELLVYQHLFPLFHYQVGTEERPADVLPSGQTEIEDIQLKVAIMPSDGCWVTSERHNIKPLTADSGPVAVKEVIEHFKQRIYTGLGNSSVDMGEGGTSNRSTAQTMSRNLVDDTKADQKEFASQFKAYVIRELLLESTFSDGTILNEENEVELKFKEIDFEARQAKENHFVDIFLKNAITHDEMRIELGYEPFAGDGWPTANSKSRMMTKGDGDWARTNYGLVERDKVILQSLDEPGTDTAKSEAKSRTTANKSKSAGGNSVTNKNKPSNQHGTRTSTKVNRDAFGARNTLPSLDTIFLHKPPLQTLFVQLRKDVVSQIHLRGLNYREIQVLIDSAFAQARDRLVALAQRTYRIGIRDARADVWSIRTDRADERIHRHIDRYIVKLKNELARTVKRNTIKSDILRTENAIIVGAVFDSLEHRTSMIDDSEIMRAYNYGKASGYRSIGFTEMKSVRHGTQECEICDGSTLSYTESDVIIYEDLPPRHPHCTCTMETPGGNVI
jgi:hypothetical protein